MRAAFYWRAVQPTGPGDADLVRDSTPLVLAAAARGLDVLPVLQGTPDLGGARARATPARRPRDPRDFARFLTLLVTRYGPTGSFWAEHPEVAKRPIRAWQIWNEPNITALLERGVLGAALRRSCSRPPMRRCATPTRSAKTVLAGLPNDSWVALHRIYAAGGRSAFDVVALHPYTSKPSNVIKLDPALAGRRCGRATTEAAGVGHRAVVAGVRGQDAGARAASTRPTPARPRA